MQAAKRAIGVLGVVRNGPLTPAERTELSTIASQAAVAVERLYLLGEAQRAEMLARTDELKSALMSAVSHDLRTPLASITASVTSLMDPDMSWDEETRHDFLQGIYDEAQRLNRLVGNLLAMSRIEGGALHPEKDWYSVGEVIESVIQRMEPRLVEHQLTIEVAEDLPLVLLDFTQIDQVLTNLLENALKYTPPGTAIQVIARRADTDNRIEVSVQDSGPGVPRDALGQLFDKFYRVEQRSESSGTGLGLAIAKGLVEAHRGTISATNIPSGGLKITFTLPVTRSTNEMEPSIGASEIGSTTDAYPASADYR
jgi:two-component system sensor histidine kinase KdpD